MRHLDQATTVAIASEVDDALDQELVDQMNSHSSEPLDAVRRAVVDAAHRWAARQRELLEEHAGGRVEVEEPEPETKPGWLALPPGSNGTPGRNGAGHGG